MRLPERETWQRAALYALFAASPWSISAIDAASLALLGLGALELWREPGAPRAPRRFALPFALFAAACLLSALANPGRLANLAELAHLYRLLLPFALLPALARVDRRGPLAVLAVGALLLGVYGAVQFQAGVDWVRPAGEKLVRPSRLAGALVFHAQGTFTHHLTYAGFELLALAFFLALFLADRARWRWLWLAAACSSAAGLLFSMGRSGWIGGLVGCSLLLLRLPRRVAFPLLGGGLAAGALLAAGLATGRLQAAGRPDAPVLVQRLLHTSLANDRDRLYMWEAGWLGFRAHPILGIGLGNDRTDYEQYRRLVAERHGGHRYLNPPHVGVHNLYLQLAYELGSLGLAAWLLVAGSVLSWCAAGLRRAGPGQELEAGILWGSAAALAGSMAAALFENNLLDAEVQNLLALLMGLALHAGRVVGVGGVRAAARGDTG